MKTALLVFLTASLAACAVPQGGPGYNPFLGGFAKRAEPAEAAPQYVDEQVEVRTEPPGARIHVNDAFAGYAPLRYTVRRLWRGQPGYMTLDTMRIEALPVAAGQCVQAGVYGQNNQRVPSPVVFDMGACAPAAPRGR